MKAVWFCLLMAVPVGAGEVAGLADLPVADVVLLGEIHDNPRHHENQAQAVLSLQPSALVFEMLNVEQAARITPQNRADPGLGVVLGWEAAGWSDFAMYQPILMAAPLARVYGAAIDRVALQGVREVAAVMALLPDPSYGLATPLAAADQAAREAEQAAAHCNALPTDLLPYMVAVQRLRDASFAATALRALRETGGPVVVITGTGHVRRDQGIPAALALAAPDVQVLAVGQLEADPGPDAPYDLWLITEPTPRPDPCAAFGAGN